MAVASIVKMRLVGLTSERDNILNALSKTNAVEIKEVENGFSLNSLSISSNYLNGFKEKRDKVNLLISLIQKYALNSGNKTAVIKDGFTVSLSEFNSILQKENEILSVADSVIELNAKIIQNKRIVLEKSQLIKEYEPYLKINREFSKFKGTNETKAFFGLIPNSVLEKVKNELEPIQNIYYEFFETATEFTPLFVLAYKKVANEVDNVLAENSFNACKFIEDGTATSLTEDLKEEIKNLEKGIENDSQKIESYSSYTKDGKILLDRYSFELEKIAESGKFKSTANTFLLEAYVPEKLKQRVLNEVEKVTENVAVDFLEIADGEFAPTYLDNSGLTENFEFVTNMYSVPKYKSLDPNGVMGFFFSLFLGMITADWGYGIMLFIACVLFSKKANGGTKRLSKILALGGIFAIPFGLLFDSVFGYPLIHKICENALGTQNAYKTFYSEHIDAITSFSSIAGISIPTMLLWSMLFGVVHLAVGYFLKALQCFKNKDYIGGIAEGISWVLFLIGLAIFAYSLIEGIESSLKSTLLLLGLIITAVGLLIAVVLSGRNDKGLKKAVSGFVSVYGIINLLSDILSYARLYGLMLSGSQIASIFTNTIAIDMLFKNGVGGIIGGILVIVAGNIFNLAIGVLGAYIHDSRLQYVEFFGKFYEGDGELFKPMGGKNEHIILTA